MILSDDTQDFEAPSKGYRYVNGALLFWILFLGFCFFFPSFSIPPSFLFIFGPLMVILNFAFIFVTAYLGRMVMGSGWILSLFVSLFGHFIAAIIFSRIAAAKLGKNGYKVGLMKAVKMA